VFVLCLAEIFGKYTEKYIKNHCLKPLERKASGSLIKSGIFKGWLRNPDYKQKNECVK
jgi:menaquinone-dependent protoporphyrinogen oxidase